MKTSLGKIIFHPRKENNGGKTKETAKLLKKYFFNY